MKVLKKDAQAVKLDLIEKKVLSKNHRSVVEKDYVYFPVLEKVEGYSFAQKDCEEIEHVEVSFHSFDHVGDIAIVAEDVELSEAKKLLSQGNVAVVLRKKGIHHGEFRTQDLVWVGGEKRKETIYRENGVVMQLDVETCYFSPRLSTERRRVSDLVQEGERILVLFSGVGPYPLVLAKHTKAKEIVGVEKNPVAHTYALKNCAKYKQIQLYNCDARDFKIEGEFDRVFMPLPKSAEEFLDVAVRYVKKGGVIHFYDFVYDGSFPEESVAKVSKHVQNFEVLVAVKCGQYAPRKYRVCLDLEILS